ncbi:MAG: amidohydrolase family protein [Pseudomonadota bacterium]
MKIDAHQHFWSLARGDYGWLTPDLAPIYRDFSPSDLAPLLAEQGIEGTVLVQAAPTLEETHYMLALADAHDFIGGVVGWVDFESEDAPQTIAKLSAHPKLVGLRPMIQDIEDPDWMLGDGLTPAFEAMIAHDLVFDALTLPRHLKNLLQLIGRHRELKTVIDHGSKPEIEKSNFMSWADDMATLAQETNASVKLSGLVTEAGSDWTVETLAPYVDHMIEQFGPSRILWGSDWPVCILASSYQTWCTATHSLLQGHGESAKAAIMGLNAQRIYNLGGTS